MKGTSRSDSCVGLAVTGWYVVVDIILAVLDSVLIDSTVLDTVVTGGSSIVGLK